MTITMKPLLLASALLAASMAHAQEATTEGEAPTPVGELATGVAVGPQPGQLYAREEHGDFQVRCIKAPEGQAEPCQLFQRMSDQEGNPTADINFFDVPGDGQVVAGATVLTPLQTLLTAAVRLSIDGSAPRAYPFSFCDAQGCYSRMGFTAAEVDQFKKGAKATITVVPALAPDQEAILTLSLSGFTAGLAAVETPAQ